MDKLTQKNPLELWSKALEALQKEFDAQLFDRWLKPIKIKELQDNEVVLSVRDEFFKTWVMDHYQDKIYSALKNLLNNPDITIRFEIQDEVVSKNQPEPEIASQPRTAPASASNAPFYPGEIVLNNKYTFESFVVGPSNRFAHAASMAVAETDAVGAAAGQYAAR